jgi:hypothetical protein
MRNIRPIDQAEPNTEAGGAEKLGAAIEAAKAAGYLGGLWDNYRNFGLNSPSYNEQYGHPRRHWRNGFRLFLGRRFSHEICPLEAVKLFQHNMD